MTSLLSTIFGNISFDDRTSTYYWHPWMDDETNDGTDDFTDDPQLYNDE